MVKEVLRLLSRTVDKSISMRPTCRTAWGPSMETRARSSNFCCGEICASTHVKLCPIAGTLPQLLRPASGLDEQGAAREIGGPRGDYILLKVGDTGHGMDAETLQRIFEPFFSTKKEQPDKKHHGLGLATGFGIVRGHGGVIQADSKPGEGTTFTVCGCLSGQAFLETVPAGDPTPPPVSGGREQSWSSTTKPPLESLWSECWYNTVIGSWSPLTALAASNSYGPIAIDQFGDPGYGHARTKRARDLPAYA